MESMKPKEEEATKVVLLTREKIESMCYMI